MSKENQRIRVYSKKSLVKYNFQSKEAGRDKVSIINQEPHLIRDTLLESDKNTRKYHTQESQEVSPFSAGDHKAAVDRQKSDT